MLVIIFGIMGLWEKKILKVKLRFEKIDQLFSLKCCFQMIIYYLRSDYNFKKIVCYGNLFIECMLNYVKYGFCFF